MKLIREDSVGVISLSAMYTNQKKTVANARTPNRQIESLSMRTQIVHCWEQLLDTSLRRINRTDAVEQQIRVLLQDIRDAGDSDFVVIHQHPLD